MPNRFLVSTTHHLLAVEPASGQMWRIHSGSGLYFGLAEGPGRLLYVACRNTVLGPNDNQVRSAEQGSILVLDSNFHVCEELRPEFPLRDVHGIGCFDGRIWVTCSYDNMVAIYELASGKWSKWYPAPNPAHRDRDVHHFNTIRFMDGRVCLLAHHFGPSELLFYTYPDLQLDSPISLGRMAHDIFPFNNALATCSSADGWIVNMHGRRLRTGNFPRGFAAAAEGNLLGMSMHAPSDKRQDQDGILRWYTPDWRFQTDYLLPRVGMVLDVLEIGDEDRDWSAVELWPQAEITHGKPNRLAPGNRYAPDSFASASGSAALEWHGSEGTHCWMAARDAGLSVLINPGETHLQIQLSSANPDPYSGEIWLDGRLLGTATFAGPSVQSCKHPLSPSLGSAVLFVRVPRLWKPVELIPGSSDERSLGLALHSVELVST